MTKADALRKLLRDGRWHSHLELRRVGGTRFGARLAELRAEGFDHETRWMNGGWQYRRA